VQSPSTVAQSRLSTPKRATVNVVSSEEEAENVPRQRRPRGGKVFADYVTRRDIAKLLGISTATLSRMEKAGKLPAGIFFGGVKLYKKAEIDAWIAQLTEPNKELAPQSRRKREGKKKE
jgi:excisionase family DNA binding protein